MWEGYLTDGRLDQVRVPIADSWRRSESANLSPSWARAPTLLPDRRDVGERWEAHSLAAAVPMIRRWLGSLADATNQLIVVSDPDGLLLWLDGNMHVRSAAADAMNFVEGAIWSEFTAGTNAIGTALATDHPVQVHAAEHFSEVVHGWTCSAAPIHDPDDGRLLGIIDLTGQVADAHPRSVGAVLAAARAIEAELRVSMQGHDARLREQYLERMTLSHDKLALVARSGRVIADHPDGYLRAASVEVPAEGGVIVLADGRSALAEPLPREVGYLVRPLDVQCRRRRARAPRSVGDRRDDIDDWRRTQLELIRLAEEQAALRRVATLVAGQATSDEIFGTVAEEVARLLRADRGTVCRYEEDGAMTVAAFWNSDGRRLPDGVRLELDGDSVAAAVQQLGRSTRRDSYEGASGRSSSSRRPWAHRSRPSALPSLRKVEFGARSS
jgi:transcriptional regulator of acetoin/glycerol metabolism